MTNEKLTELNDHIERNVKTYGVVQIDEYEAAALKLDPKYRVYKRIDEIDLEVEIENGCIKERYHFIGENNNQNAGQDSSDNNDDDNFRTFYLENKIANYANIRDTDLPTVLTRQYII